MKRFLLIVLVLALLITMSACGSDTKKDANTETKDISQTDATETGDAEPTDAERSAYTIKAYGIDLKYPEEWKDKVEVEIADDKAAFSAGETKLFDLLFNSVEGNVLGTVRGEAYTVISVIDYVIEDDDVELLSMQKDLNFILQNLEKDYDFVEGEALWTDDDETFEIQTSVVTLRYPLKWKDKVTVDVSDTMVCFSDGDTKIFDLIFEESETGYLLGTYGDTPIYIIDYPVETSDDSAMLADINVILKYLQEDDNFTMS